MMIAPAVASWRSADLPVGIGQAALGYVLSGLGACLILLARDFAVARGDLTWLPAGFGGALLLLGLLGPWLLAAVGAGLVLRASAAALALGAILVAAAPSLVVAQAAALALGLGGAGVVLASPAVLTGPGLARRFTRVNAAASVAGVTAPVLISLLDGLSGHGRLALLVPVPGLLWIVAAPVHGSPVPAESRPSAVAGRTETGSRRAVGLAWISVVLAVSAEFAFLVWGAARVQDSGVSASTAAGLAAAFPIGMAVGRIAGPRLIGRAPVVVCGALLAMTGALAAAAPAGPMLATAALGVAGLGIAVLYPVTLARLVAVPGLRLRQGAALGAAASGTAVLLAPILLEALAARTSLQTGFLAVAPALVVLLALQVSAARADRHGQPEA